MIEAPPWPAQKSACLRSSSVWLLSRATPSSQRPFSGPPAWEIAGIRTLRRDDSSAEVEVYSATGDRHTLSLVREGPEWKVELPGE